MNPTAGHRIEQRRSDWARLAALLDRVEGRGLSSLSPDELSELARLHRRVASHLSQAKSGAHDPSVVSYLNGLVGRSHNVVYRVPSRVQPRALVNFALTGYPRLVQRMWPYVLVAALLLFGSAFFAYVAALSDPTLALLLVPPQFHSVIGPGAGSGLPAEGIPVGMQTALSAFIMQNNIKVGLMAFAGGIFAGAYTIYSLVQNGLMVGGIAGAVHHYGDPWPFMSLVVPHGVIELWAIVLAGAAGFRLGWSLVAPGRLRRLASLRVGAIEAVQVVLGTALLFVVAALIEGFVTPSALPAGAKLAVGPLSGLVMLVYLYWPRRGGDQASVGASQS